MRNRVLRAIDALFDRKAVRVAPNVIALPDGSEYVRIERPRAFRRSDLPVGNVYVGEEHQAQRREAALEILEDDETHGFLLITLKPRSVPAARVIAQVRPEWREYVGNILGRIIREYATADGPRTTRQPAR